MKKSFLHALFGIALLFSVAVAAFDSKADDLLVKASVELNDVSLDAFVAVPADGVSVDHLKDSAVAIHSVYTLEASEDLTTVDLDTDDDPGKKLIDAELSNITINLNSSKDKAVHNTRYLQRFSQVQSRQANPVTSRGC